MTVYNEEAHLEACLQHILAQSIKPNMIFVVDDGSNDKTSEILQKYPVHTLKINEPKYHVASFNMIRALNQGYSKIKELCTDFEFLLKIDADSYIPSNYVETLIKIMMKNPKLGIVSGGILDSNIWEHRASDGARLYRIECWNSIKGLDFVIHWDTHAILKAYRNGWLVRTIDTLKYIEVRTHERSTLYQWYLSGTARFYLGFPLIHTFLVFLMYISKKPFFIGSFTMFMTHLIYRLCKDRIFEQEYYQFLDIFSKNEIKLRLRKIING
jgi:glycosyltransferase involved in cell wall biosynthesis